MTSSPRARFSQNTCAYWVGVLSAVSRQRRRQSEIPSRTRSSPGPSIQYSMRLPFASRAGSSSHGVRSSSAFGERRAGAQHVAVAVDGARLQVRAAAPAVADGDRPGPVAVVGQRHRRVEAAGDLRRRRDRCSSAAVSGSTARGAVAQPGDSAAGDPGTGQREQQRTDKPVACSGERSIIPRNTAEPDDRTCGRTTRPTVRDFPTHVRAPVDEHREERAREPGVPERRPGRSERAASCAGRSSAAAGCGWSRWRSRCRRRSRWCASTASLTSEIEELLPRNAPSVSAVDELRQRLPGLSTLGVVVATSDPSELRAAERLIDDLAARVRRYPPSLVRAVKTGAEAAAERRFLAAHLPLFVDVGRSGRDPHAGGGAPELGHAQPAGRRLRRRGEAAAARLLGHRGEVPGAVPRGPAAERRRAPTRERAAPADPVHATSGRARRCC